MTKIIINKMTRFDVHSKQKIAPVALESMSFIELLLSCSIKNKTFVFRLFNIEYCAYFKWSFYNINNTRANNF